MCKFRYTTLLVDYTNLPVDSIVPSLNRVQTGTIDELAERIDAFQLVLEAPAKAIDTRAVTTAGIEQAIANSTRILTKRLNRHVKTLRRSHPDFAAAYDQANVSDKRRGTHSKAVVSVNEEVVLPAKSIAVVPPVETSATGAALGRYSANGNGSKATESLELVR